MSRRAIPGRLALAGAVAFAVTTLAWGNDAAQAGASARVNYMLHCMGCHVEDGSGSPGKVPSVRDSLPALSSSLAGRRYLVQVPGASLSPLSDAELARVLNWMVRTLSAQPVPPGFSDFTAAEVTEYRKAPLVDVRETRARLLARPAAQPVRAGDASASR